MPGTTTYTDAELAAAVRASRSWRGVLRHLGRPESSASALRGARRRAEALELDHSHFTGQRRWSDAELATALRESRSWTQVCNKLGYASNSGTALSAIKGHALRLGASVDHLDARLRGSVPSACALAFDSRYLHRAGPTLAATWFSLCGYEVCWPLEPCRYDLLVAGPGGMRRIQVKTTTRRVSGSWFVQLKSSRHRGAVVYTADEVDDFFIVDGDLRCYLIPLETVGGYQAIVLRAYERFRIAGRLTDAMTSTSPARGT